MKKNIVLFYAVSFLSITFLSCNYSTEPEVNPQVVVQNGSYSKIQSTSADEHKYHIEFEYQVQDKECIILGFGIKWNSGNFDVIDFREHQTIIPGNTYKFSETFNLEDDISENPTITIKGYNNGSKPDLLAGYSLHSN